MPNNKGDEQLIRVSIGKDHLEANLAIPAGAQGVVLFAHGSGSSRHSPRNRHVAQVLRRASLATLLIDLLTPEEEQIDVQTRRLRFNIELLAQRVESAIEWLSGYCLTDRLRIGLFGASTGAAAALVAAARHAERVGAIVSRGGRPDLAGACLNAVTAPTLLIVGGDDPVVIQINRQAYERLSQVHEKQLTIVPGASHLFEEPGTLEQVAKLAADWFSHFLAPISTTSSA